MALDLDAIQRNRERLTQGSGKFWRAKEGINKIRIFSFSHKVTKIDVKNGFFPKEKIGKELELSERPITRQWGFRADNRPVVSNPETLNRYNSLKRSDPKGALEYRPSIAYFMNVADTTEVERGIRVFACTSLVFDAISNYLLDPEYDNGADLIGSNGWDFIIEYSPREKTPLKKYAVRLRKEGKSEKLPSDLENEVIDFYGPENSKLFGESPDDPNLGSEKGNIFDDLADEQAEKNNDADDELKGELKDEEGEDEEGEDEEEEDEEEELKDEEEKSKKRKESKKKKR